jgi:CheY-like chemotaxis protein
VDDNRDAAAMLADAIRGWGGTAIVAYDAPAALEIARTTNFDVALLDIGMPQMNGLELTRELRKLEGTRDLRSSL